MTNNIFDLRQNAFYVLKADYTSSQADIADLVDDAEFDGEIDAESIHRAQQSLLTPKLRLVQEVSWLPELSGTQTAQVLALIGSVDPVETRRTVEHLPELAGANVLAQLCQTSPSDKSLIQSILRRWTDIDKSYLLDFINEARARSNFPRVGQDQLADALDTVLQQHASVLANSVWEARNPGALLEEIIEGELSTHERSAILDQLVRQYDSLSEAQLSTISTEIDSCIDAVGINPASSDAFIDRIVGLLSDWDAINQPVQVYEQHLGHEEGRSKQIYKKVRSLCLELANERGEYGKSRRLSEALLNTFPELESVAQQLRADVHQLETLGEEKQRFAVVEPLAEACELAKGQISPLRTSLRKSGFGRHSPTPTKEIVLALTTALGSLDDPSLAIIVVRDLTLFINNEKNDPETAFLLIDGLINFAGAKLPADLLTKLKEEREVLNRNWKMNELERKKGDLPAMTKVIDDMLVYATGSDKRTLEQLKNQIESKRRSGRVKNWLFFGVIAIVVGWVIVSETSGTSSSRTTYRPSATSAEPAGVSSPPASFQTTNAYQEERPPIGYGRTLTKNQIRYCVYQGERLDMIRGLTSTNSRIDRFNALIDDYNKRCSNFRYRQGTLESVQREVSTRMSILRDDVQRIVASWP